MEHNIEELRDRFKYLLDRLCADYGLNIYVGSDFTPEEIECNWQGYNDAADNLGIWTSSGATKFVIGDDYNDYIIKFSPYTGGYNYCQREVDVYHEAEKKGLANRFAWCEFLFNYEFSEGYSIPVYVMEYCQCSYESISDEVDEYTFQKYRSDLGLEDSDETRDRYYSERNYESQSEEMINWAFSCWGIERGVHEDIVRFMRSMYINDIHPGNWGWTKNGLVLVDYSGYGEDYCLRSINY